jgi:transcriptional regulator with XRE-family HTH domain
MDEVDPYDVWDLTPLPMPARSTLYAPAPIGMGTTLVESLSSYVVRLAEAHCVFSGRLMSRVIVPLVPGYSPLHPYALFREDGEKSTLLNGTGLSARYAVQALEKLTGRTDLVCLTLLPLAAIFPAIGGRLLRATKAWCSLCYQDWRARGQQVYDPLLWFFQDVALCSHHGCDLHTQCPYHNCAKSLPAVAWRSRSGYCSYCQRWLGLSQEGVKVMALRENQDRPDQQQGIQMVGDMLTLLSTRAIFPDQQRISKVLTAVAQLVTQGNLRAFARVLGLPPKQVYAWCHGDRRPEMTMLFRLCHDLGLALSDFLFQEIEMLQPCLNVASELLPHLPKKSNPIPVEPVYLALEQILASQEYPPLSLAKVARQLGQRYDTLYRVHPVACYAIAARYKSYLQQRKETRLRRLQEEIRQVALQLLACGIAPTQKRIAPHLSRPGILRNPLLRAFLHDVCRELREGA